MLVAQLNNCTREDSFRNIEIFQKCSLESFTNLSKLLVNHVNFSSSLLEHKQNYSSTQYSKTLSRVYDVIFYHRKGTCDLFDSGGQHIELNEIEKIIWHSHILRKKRLFDQANQLDFHLKTLQNKGLLHQNSDVRCVLQFLSYLIDANFLSSNESFSFPSSWIIDDYQNNDYILPNGPLNYNDTRLHHVPLRRHYTHFPSYLFEIETKIQFGDLNNYWSPFKFDQCWQEPGSGLQFSFFQSEEISSSNCLGALIGPKKFPLTPDSELNIPDLPTTPDGYSFIPVFLSQNADQNCKSTDLNCDKVKSKASHISLHDLFGTCDEGYGSSQGSCAGISPTKDCIDIWDEVLKSLPLPNHHTWESIGKPFAHKEKPFITEAGNEVTQKIWSIDCYCLNNLTASSVYHNNEINKFSMQALIHDIIHLLIGIPSSNFIFNKESKKFEVKNGIYYQGITSESFRLQAQEFITCGNQIASLDHFVNEQHYLSENENGLVFRAFVTSVKDFLFLFRQKALLLIGEPGILSLKLHSEKLRRKAQFLYHICFSVAMRNGEHCKGLNLIGSLKRVLLSTRISTNFYLLLSLLIESYKPFFRFLEKWIYEGELYDPASEFMIGSNNNSYWVKDYCYNNSILKEVPDSLKEVVIQAFHCGKSLNLLQLCSPQNFLLRRSCIPSPKIQHCMSINDVELTKIKCSEYFNNMKSSMKCVTLNEYDTQKERKKIMLLYNYQKRQHNTLQEFSESSMAAYIANKERKKLEMMTIESDIEQAKEWKEIKHRAIQAENRKIDEQQEKMIQDKDKNEQNTRNKLIETHHHIMASLEKRELIADEKLRELSNSRAGKRNEKESPQSPQDCYGESSLMSLTSDTLDTPIDDEIPEIIKDNEQVHNFFDNVSQPDKSEEVNNNPNSKEIVETVTQSEERDRFHLGQEAEMINRKVMRKEYGLESYHEQLDNRENITDATELLLDDNANSEVVNAFIKDSLNGNISTSSRVKRSQLGSNSITSEVELHVTPSSSLFSTSHKRPRPISETVESIPEEEFQLDNSHLATCLNKGLGIRKSKSDTFHPMDSEKCRRKGLQSSLFNLNENERPVLVDNVGGEVLKHRGRNIHGHVSDSVIQKILWSNTSEWKTNEGISDHRFVDTDILNSRILAPTCKISPYQQVQLSLSDQKPISDISKRALGKKLQSEKEENLLKIELPPPALLRMAPTCLVRALSIHVSTQTRLVNEMLLSHFLITEQLIDHFAAMKFLLLLDDVSFARPLASTLINKLSNVSRLPRHFNPVDLNGLLHDAVTTSQFVKSPFADNLSFVVTNIPPDINYISNPLDYIQLRYRVKWPNNIILNDDAINAYGRVWKFLVKLHYVVWAMDDSFKHAVSLNRDPSYTGINVCKHFHQISIFRHELHQFVCIIFNYVAHQVIQSGWADFQSALRKKVTTLDDLNNVHWNFLDNIIGRCFLTTESSIVQDILQSIFDKIITFRSTLIGHRWTTNKETNELEHPQFTSLMKTTQEFKQLVLFLNKLIKKILSWTYSEHLHDLVDQLNFNENYETMDIVTDKKDVS